MRIAAALVLALATTSCATTREIEPSADADLGLRRVHDVLVKRGFRCSLDEVDLTCEGDRTYKIVLKYLTAPSRILFYAWFETERSCEDQQPQITDYNSRYLIQLSCVDDMLRFFSSTYVPEAGLDGVELETFLVSWSDEINATASEVGIFTEEDQGESPAAPSPPESQTL